MKLSFDTRTILKYLSYGSRIRPARDWYYLLLLTILLVVLSVAWNVWLFRSVEEGGPLGEVAAPEAFDAAPIESVRSVFEARASEAARYRDAYRFVDPLR